MSEFLVVDNVTKQFGGLKAVDGVSFSVDEGSLSAIIGPNGAGKTTMFNMIAGAMRTTAGSIIFRKHRVTNPVSACRLGIARTFQNVKLFHEMTVLENVLVGMGDTGFLKGSIRLPGSVSAERLRMKRAYYMLEEAGLEKLHNHRAGMWHSDSRGFWR